MLHSRPRIGLAQLSTALAHCIMGCFALPSQIGPLKHLEGKWSKTALGGQLSCTNSESRAQEWLFWVQLPANCALLPLFSLSKQARAGTVAFLSLLYTPTGFHSPTDSWFYRSSPFYEEGMQAPVVPLGDRSCGTETGLELGS